MEANEIDKYLVQLMVFMCAKARLHTSEAELEQIKELKLELMARLDHHLAYLTNYRQGQLAAYAELKADESNEPAVLLN